MKNKISILVPCCNVEKYVRECLDSIKAQTYTNLEVICIDDGSIDSTGEIIDEYVATDSRFKVIHKSNSGYGDSMNKGLDICTGDYIGIVESDDWIEPDMYEVLLNKCLENNLELVHCLWQSGPNGVENIDRMEWIRKNVVYSPLEEKTPFYLPPSIWAALYRRDLLEKGQKVRFLPTSGASFQDTSFAFKVHTKAHRFMMLDRALHHYRINQGSSVISKGKVNCIVDEWQEMRRWVNEDDDLKSTITQSSLFLRIINSGLKWNYGRLASVQQLQFLRAVSRYFCELEADGLFNLHEFAKKEDGRNLLLIKNDPLSYNEKLVYSTVNRLYSKYSKRTVVKQDSLISVIVPCFNTAKYIRSSLASIQRQDYRNIEIICVDDCSTDETVMLVKHVMRKDSRISLISTKKNSGPSVSRNLALEHCRGEYIVFVDGDDCLMPGAISHLLSRVDDESDLVVGTISVGYEGGREKYGHIPKSDDHYYTITNEAVIDVRREKLASVINMNASLSGKLWKKSILDKYGIRMPEGLFYEDANFYCKYISVAKKIRLTPFPIYYYQRHLSGSIMSSTFSKASGYAIDHLYIIDDYYKFLCKNKLLKIGQKILELIYEPYFWFAYNNSPESEHEKVIMTFSRLLKEQKANIDNNLLFKWIVSYDDVSKAELFMDYFYTRINPERRKKRPLYKRVFHGFMNNFRKNKK